MQVARVIPPALSKFDRARSVAASGDSREVRILLIGTGHRAVRAVRALQDSSRKVHFLGALDSEPQPELASEFPGIPWLGGFDELRDVLVNHLVDETHVALPMRSCFDEIEAMQLACQEVGVPITLRVNLLADCASRTREVDPVVVTFNRHHSLNLVSRVAKRVLDVVVSATALVLMAPLIGLIALAIRITSPGPVLFTQPRMGMGRRVFGMVKFRTMVENAEQVRKEIEHMNDARGISFKLYSDPRVTRIGSVLRRSSLDELPQLLNVLRGEMSLVGPRPIPVWVAEQLREPKYFRRFAVLPGITGLWQVQGRQQDFDLMASKDLRYLDMWSFGLDLKILAATLPAVLGGKGAH